MNLDSPGNVSESVGIYKRHELSNYLSTEGRNAREHQVSDDTN